MSNNKITFWRKYYIKKFFIIKSLWQLINIICHGIISNKSHTYAICFVFFKSLLILYRSLNCSIEEMNATVLWNLYEFKYIQTWALLGINVLFTDNNSRILWHNLILLQIAYYILRIILGMLLPIVIHNIRNINSVH